MPESTAPVTPSFVEGTPEAIEATNLANLMDEDGPTIIPAEVKPDVPPVVVSPVVAVPSVVPGTPAAVVEPVVEPTVYKTGDPFLDGYHATPVEQRAEYVANYNQIQSVLSMESDPGLKFVYQQQVDDQGQRVYTDDEIDADLNGRSKINKDREWNSVRGNIQAEQARASQIPEPTQAEIDAYLTQANTDSMAKVSPLLLSEDALTEVFGMPYTKEMKDEVKANVIKLNSINPKTGDPYLYQYLSEDNNLMDSIRASTFQKGNKLNIFLSNFKEDFKAETFDKLGVTLKPQGGTAHFAATQTEEDLL